jgi:8-oxo-dGTP diphosphatase
LGGAAPVAQKEMTNVVEVAAAVLLRPDGEFLLTQRPSRTVYAGYWEFPGGKVESGETAQQALSRELREELGIDIGRPYPWLTQHYIYPHADVRLEFFRVREWRGEARGIEGQNLTWCRPDAIAVEPLLPANGPVLRALSLPTEYAVSDVKQMGEAMFFSALERRLAAGLKLLQLREKEMSEEAFRRFARTAVDMAHRAGARVLVNGPERLATEVGADGVQLSALQLQATQKRPEMELVGASVHGREELRRAEALGADFAVLGAIAATPTHPDGRILGWQGFAEIVAGAAIPVYAIGGVKPAQLDEAWAAGAQGIAMIRGSWT